MGRPEKLPVVVDAEGAPGEGHPVLGDEPDDLGEPEGDEGEVVAAEPEGGESREEADGGGQVAATRSPSHGETSACLVTAAAA
jgi:hypothetical protein